MFGEATMFLFDVLVQPFAAVLLLRFNLQWLRSPMRNPVGEFVMALTDFAVLRLRRFIPSARGLDSASLLLALLVEMLYLAGYVSVQGFELHGFPFLGLMLWALVKLLKISIYLLMAAVFIQAILSWVNPYTAFAPLLTSVTYRFLQPLRRFLPMLGSLDLSALLLFIICQLIVIVPVRMLEVFAMSLL